MRKLITTALFAACILPLPGLAVPAAAQSGSVIMDIFGDQKCPESNGEEIVVCRRLPANEQFRIPKDLREAAKDAPAPNWSARALNLEYVGQHGASTCTPAGGGSETGCWTKLMKEARAERKDAKSAEPVLP
jgi:hypothetical protein